MRRTVAIWLALAGCATTTAGHTEIAQSALPARCTINVAPVDFTGAQVNFGDLRPGERAEFEKTMRSQLMDRLVDHNGDHMGSPANVLIEVRITQYDVGTRPLAGGRAMSTSSVVTLRQPNGPALATFESSANATFTEPQATSDGRARVLGRATADAIDSGSLKSLPCLH